jgi:hypothetical protein
MLLAGNKLGVDASKKVAAHQIVLASFNNNTAVEDAECAMNSDVISRQAGTDVYASNIDNMSLREQCTQKLELLFNDPDETIRGAASDCFRHLDDEGLIAASNFVSAFIQSEAFRMHADSLTYQPE